MTHYVAQLRTALPRGNTLGAEIWARRHRLLLVVLALHVPGLVAVGAVAGRPLAHQLLEVMPLIALLGVGALSRSRVVGSCAVTLGLVGGASLLVHATGGVIEAHFHYFVVLAFVALYQDWRPLLIAVAYVMVSHGAVGAVAPGSIYSHPGGAEAPWLWAVIHGGFLLAAASANVIFWKQTERQQMAAQEYYSRLYEGERAVVEQLRQAETVKSELIGVVGHEFRTPLTAIRGFARTLEARHGRMDPEAVQTCTQAIEREAKRLTRMVANLLTASEEIEPDEHDRACLSELAAAAVRDVVETTPVASRRVTQHVAADHVVRMNAAVTHQLLFNLLDNAVKFAADDSDVRVSSRRDGNAIVLEVANVGPAIGDRDRERIFDAFVQADSSDTRRYGGIGLGLHIARKIVTSYGGRIDVHCEGPLVIFRASLPAAPPSGAPRPAPAPREPSTLRG
ncbi:MAG TPA: HAMP domain-containing sensor histidine kinase [Egibacteraceae bacterium]|nr:HAMP domain-containing sensor histidine kinase [Egibacteraceae bacterium]